MTIAHRLEAALEQAWSLKSSENFLDQDVPPDVVADVQAILKTDSAPNRQYLLTIAAATADDPSSNPASIQQAAGVDRRGQAKVPRDVLSAFKDDKGLTLKISQDPGVSNQWREREIDGGWVNRRKSHDRPWATAFLRIVEWLKDAESEPIRSERAQWLLELVAFEVVSRAINNALNYPQFNASPAIAMFLVHSFIARSSSRPDAMEAVVTVAARSLSNVLVGENDVVRGDINSPDAIDVLIYDSDGVAVGGIEVTDEAISLGKLQHEVLPAMQKHGISSATVVSNGVKAGEETQIEEWQQRTYVHFGQRIDLASVDDIGVWLTFPATPLDLATRFVRAIGPELDQFSTDSNRRAWYDTLLEYVAGADRTP